MACGQLGSQKQRCPDAARIAKIKDLTHLFRLTWCELMGVTVAAVAEPKSDNVVLRLYHGIMQIVRGGGVTDYTSKL